METKQEYLIGTGILTWDKNERISDRYGSVWLMNSGNSLSEGIDVAKINLDKSLIGKHVKLMAEIVETRQSTHVGDLFRGIYPRTPKVGDLIVLGEGELFSKYNDDHTIIGLKPRDGRDRDWLNPRSLYDCHEQTVKLIVEEIK